MWIKILFGIVLIVGGAWFIRYLLTPAPGKKVAEIGREHVSAAQVAETKYNSNPPTSGPHLETWVRGGIFVAPQSEGELIHSLEHGYVIISYNCNVHLSSEPRTQNLMTKLISSAFAHGLEEEEGSPAASFVDPTIATGSAANDSEECKTLVRQLEEVGQKNRLWKLIVVPRPQLDTSIALTAWGVIDKFDEFDSPRIERFIDYYRDHGPEKTME